MYRSTTVHIFGIRHHGPGSARSLRRALEDLKPDAILLEGPPDAEAVLPLLLQRGMQPPVALFIYVPGQPQRAAFYPFAVFSPEWQALHYGLSHNIAVRFMDLPQAHQLALKEEASQTPTPEPQSPVRNPQSEMSLDPLRWLAEAAGHNDGEEWWERMVEQRRDGTDLFAAILEAMTALRESVPEPPDPIGPQREAYMRQTIRAAQRQGFERIAVVCGAWHVPALTPEAIAQAKDDKALLSGLPKVKVEATWTPWTYSRLLYFSGYGAGVVSPGWYHHLWTTPDQVTVRWMARVARLLREADLDVSPAHLIEAVRLAESLAALRNRALPGLSELNEATQTVVCFGNDTPMRLIHDRLIVGERLGTVPSDTPMPPLQRDLAHAQKRQRLPVDAAQRALDLDLRKPTDLDRSLLLHRLNLLGVRWGVVQRASTGKGTFHEVWQLQWKPELAVNVIEASVWGNTVVDAATTYARHLADQTAEAPEPLPALTHLVDQVLLADLPDALPHVMGRLQAESAVASDIAHLMNALPPLANVMRYRDVRQTDMGMVSQVVDGLVARMCVGLPGACASLNDEAAAAMFDRLIGVDSAMALLRDDGYRAMWQAVVAHLADQHGVHGLVAGRCCRLLLDQGRFVGSDVARRMSLALSPANEAEQAAAWLEGFLKGSGLLLLHDEVLWQVLDDWVKALPGETFTPLLPLLRRTFSTFTAVERRQIGERASRGSVSRLEGGGRSEEASFDSARAAKVLPLLAQLLGVNTDEH
ncbi:MAG TPA: DUF5682 family protein [Anaerolineae bacterium]|nr:DUF5682 family protein [Anaerolineae bacterium]